jgi:hypothetical protein
LREIRASDLAHPKKTLKSALSNPSWNITFSGFYYTAASAAAFCFTFEEGVAKGTVTSMFNKAGPGMIFSAPYFIITVLTKILMEMRHETVFNRHGRTYLSDTGFGQRLDGGLGPQ